MFEQLRCAIGQVRRLVAELEPDRFDGDGARTLVELFDEIERLGAAGKALATRQVVATGAWKHDGAHRDVASWFSATTGTTVGAARATLETAERVEALPTTEAAWRSGALSGAQVSVIADAAAADPDAEHEMLVRANHDGVRGLRDACARVKAAACSDENAQYERVRASRSLRCWTHPDGAGRIDIRGPVDCTARVMKALGPYERELFEQARVDGRRERPDALAFDALVAFSDAPRAEADGKPARREVTTVLRMDYAALVRGETRPGELCEIVDGGPVPVTLAQRMLEDSFVKAVLVDGTDVRAVSHLGRTIPAKLRTAVEELHPECDVEGCNVTHNLEIDHNQPLEEGGLTALWNLGRLCPHHHEHKHRHRLRLAGPPGRRRFVSANEWVPRC